jgi:DNA primase
MQQVSKQGIEVLKGANPLADVMTERGIELRKKGAQLVARCPFHGPDKTPSLSVTTGKGLFHCFGCGASGDVIGFVTKHDKVTFAGALQLLARRCGRDLDALMADKPARKASSTSSNGNGSTKGKEAAAASSKPGPGPGALADALAKVVEHYHRTFCARKDAQDYLAKRGLGDPDILRALKVGYADGSLLKAVPKTGELREALRALGVVTAEGKELLGGCIVVPLPDSVTGAWVNLYGRGVRTARHCYLPGGMRGVLNFQAAASSDEVVLAESVLDAISFHHAGIATALPIYGTNGMTSELRDVLQREAVRRVTLALDNDDAGRRASLAIRDQLAAAGIEVRIATLPDGIKDPNDLLVSCNGDAPEAFRRLLDDAEPRPRAAAVAAPAAEPAGAPGPPPVAPEASAAGPQRKDGELVLRRGPVTYRARVHPALAGRLRATVRVETDGAFHVDTLDLYASKSRTEYARRVMKVTGQGVDVIETDLLALVVEAERIAEEKEATGDEPAVATMTDAEREEALALLKRPDLLAQVAADIDSLGYVGEETNKRLLYLVAVSRKLADPLSAIVLSQSGAGKSGITEVIERLTPPEDVVLLTRLTPQSLYYVAPGFLDRKLVIVEERYGSTDADYSIRVLQSRKKLIAAAPVKDPSTGNMRTKVFTVEARAAFIEATTASSVNHENATRCFELTMDESAEQTKRIHERQRIAKTRAGLELRRAADAACRRHWNAQRLLEPVPVVIPFADQLTFPAEWMRTRRDHARFLNLIEVSAFLHQHQRQRDEGAVVATVADYAVAYALGAEILAETLTDVRKPLRDAYRRLQALAQDAGEDTLSRREIREALNLPDSTVRRWLADLVELEYLNVVEAGAKGAGRTSRYRLLDRADENTPAQLGLLTPDELRARFRP